MEAVWVEVWEEAKAEMVPVVALQVAWEEVLVVGLTVASSNNRVSRPFYFKQREQYPRQNRISCE